MGGLPLGGLTTSLVGDGLLCFLSQAGSAVGVLLANGLAVGQVLGPVDDEDEGSDFRAVNAHVGEDAGGMGPVDGVGLDHLAERMAAVRCAAPRASQRSLAGNRKKKKKN